MGSLLVMKCGVFKRHGHKTTEHAEENTPRPKKTRMSWSQVNTMPVCFFNHKGIVDYEFIVHGQTVNQQCYLEV